MRFISRLFLLWGFAVFTCFGAPVIVVDTPEVNVGVIEEGAQKHIEHPFTIHNQGDKPLQIERVRTSCGCTVVEYDSVIAPGKTGNVLQRVDIKGMSGTISKSITISSNAPNNQDLRLVVKATIQPTIGTSPGYIQFSGRSDNEPLDLTLSSKKEDLSVKKVAFEQRSSGNRPKWQSSLPAYLDYAFSSLDSVTAEGIHLYRLRLFAPPARDQSEYGTFRIHTNHPQKPVVELRGVVERHP